MADAEAGSLRVCGAWKAWVEVEVLVRQTRVSVPPITGVRVDEPREDAGRESRVGRMVGTSGTGEDCFRRSAGATPVARSA